MNGYNSNYYNRNLLNSLSRVIQEDVFRLDSADLDDERRKRLQQAQAAADKAERDPETGLLKVSGAIQGVPRGEPGGDLYGVDREGKAFVVAGPKKKTAPTAASPTATASGAAPSAVSSPATITRQWGTGSTQNFPDMSKVPSALDRAKSTFDVGTLQTRATEADRESRIRRAEAMANFTPGFGKGMGQGDTDIVPLRASDIRPQGPLARQRAIEPPKAGRPLVNPIFGFDITPKTTGPSIQSTKPGQLGLPALERIRADEMDPRIQRQKERAAAQRQQELAARARAATNPTITTGQALWGKLY